MTEALNGKKGTFAFVPRVLAVALAAAITAALIRTLFRDQFRFHDLAVTFTMTLVYSCAVSLLAAYSLHSLADKGYWKPSGFFVAIVVCILLVANFLGCFAGAVVLYLIGFIDPGAFWTEAYFAIRFGVLITLVFGLSMSFYEVVRGRLEAATLELRTRQMEEERATKLLAEARLSSLESRIHPHFLFNTLNSISSLIPKDPAKAEEMVGQLASLLRFSLNTNSTSLVPLSQELKVVRDYLEIEKTRFGSRLRYSVDAPPELASVSVPPLSVQSLVENSVKYVIAERPQGGEIQVAASASADRLTLEVRDDGPGFALEAIPAGHGLDNLTARLTLLYGSASRIEVARNGTYSAVRFSFPNAQKL